MTRSGNLEAGHPAFSRFTTINRTICGDQVPGSLIARIYEWQPLIDFLAAAMDKPRLYPMADPLGRINVMCYRQLHFDRAEFTTTMLLQAPVSGEFKYRRPSGRGPELELTRFRGRLWIWASGG